MVGRDEEWVEADAAKFLKNEAAPNPEKKKTPSKDRKKKQKGFGRKNYFLCNLIFPFAAGGLLVLLVSLFDWSLDDDAFVTVGFSAIYSFFAYFFIVLRYKNIGYRPAWAWSLWSLIPFVNLWVTGRCLYQPADYRNTRQMDKAGRIVFWLYWLLVCSPVVITIAAELL